MKIFHIFPARLVKVLMISFFLFNVFNVQLLHAQAEEKPAAQLTPEQLKAVEGYFQNPDNKEMYLQFTAKEKMLQGKMLWNNREIIFTPQSELEFLSKDGNEGRPISAKFTKDPAGAITGVSLGNNGVWAKAKDYKPLVKEEMAHTPEQLKPFEGLYQFKRDKESFIQFMVRGNTLVLKQHGDGGEIVFVPQTELDFFNKQQLLQTVSFIKDEKGNITKAFAMRRDSLIRINKIHPTTSELKIFEGKYQSKDDADNIIQLSAKDNRLVLKQLWDNKEINLEPQTDTYFFNQEKFYSLGIIKDKDGKIVQVKLLGMDVFNKL